MFTFGVKNSLSSWNRNMASVTFQKQKSDPVIFTSSREWGLHSFHFHLNDSTALTNMEQTCQES